MNILMPLGQGTKVCYPHPFHLRTVYAANRR